MYVIFLGLNLFSDNTFSLNTLLCKISYMCLTLHTRVQAYVRTEKSRCFLLFEETEKLSVVIVFARGKLRKSVMYPSRLN